METEIYKLTQPRQYCRDYAHTDCVEYITGSMDNIDVAYIERLYDKHDVLVDAEMDLQEYNERINANCQECTPDEFGEYPSIRVIVYA